MRLPELIAAADALHGYALAVFLLSLRLATVLALTPLLQSASVPAIVRVLTVVGLAAVLAMAIPAAAAPGRQLLQDTGALIDAALRELALGVTLALGIQAAFAAFTLAGRLLDVQIGFGMGQVIDPATRQQIPILTSAFNQAAVVVFFVIDGHHALLRALAFSLERFPLGQAWPLEAAAVPVFKQVGSLFALGFALAAPVVFCLLLTELVLGVVARNLPQMNMFVVALPAKVVVGLAALALWFGGIGDAMNRIYASIYSSWNAVFALAPAGAR